MTNQTGVDKFICMKPVIGISKCLLGENVRYNAGHCKQDWIVNEMSKAVEFKPVCPEVNMGLPVPRPTMSLKNNGTEQLQIIVNDNGENLTGLAHKTNHQLVNGLVDIDGHVLKKGSPSCGLERVKVYRSDNPIPLAKGRGLYAEELVNTYPNIPCIEEGRLTDPIQAELFLIHVFTHFRFRQIDRSHIKHLQEFHRKHKFLFMSQQPSAAQTLGRLASGIDSEPLAEAFNTYYELFNQTLKTPINTGRRVNALTHVYGILKEFLTEKEKNYVLETVEKYRSGTVNFISVATLLKFLIESHDNEYLKDQNFVQPFPDDIKLN